MAFSRRRLKPASLLPLLAVPLLATGHPAQADDAAAILLRATITERGEPVANQSRELNIAMTWYDEVSDSGDASQAVAVGESGSQFPVAVGSRFRHDRVAMPISLPLDERGQANVRLPLSILMGGMKGPSLLNLRVTLPGMAPTSNCAIELSSMVEVKNVPIWLRLFGLPEELVNDGPLAMTVRCELDSAGEQEPYLVSGDLLSKYGQLQRSIEDRAEYQKKYEERQRRVPFPAYP